MHAKGNDRCATFSTRGGVLWHKEAGEIAVDKVRNHFDMECWIKPGNVLAPVQFAAPVEAPENLQNTMLQFHNEQMQRWMHSPRGLMHQELMKNTSNLRSFQ